MFTTAMSMRWKNIVFHHRRHLRWMLNVERILSDLSTAFIFRKVKLRSPSRCKTTRLQTALYQCDSSAILSQKQPWHHLRKSKKCFVCAQQKKSQTKKSLFCFTIHTGREIFLFLTRRMKSFPSRIQTQPNVKSIPEWKRGTFLCLLTH